MTDEPTRLLMAYQMGVEATERAFEHVAAHIYQARPSIGSDALLILIAEKEAQEARTDDKVLNAP